MTFNPTEYSIWYKQFPMFIQWDLIHRRLFPYKEVADDSDDKKYDLTSKIYIFMKRLGQDYRTILNMDADERDKLFSMELELINKEIEEAKKK